MAKKSIGATNKRKGSNAEREFAKEFREMGFDKCVTSRYGSRIHDDAGIDLINLPFSVQIKAGKQRGLNASKELAYVKRRTEELFPATAEEINRPIFLIHKKQGVPGQKRNEFDDIVSMSFSDFKRLLNKVQWQ
jgi:predicted glycosyltransferase